MLMIVQVLERKLSCNFTEIQALPDFAENLKFVSIKTQLKQLTRC